MKKFLAVNFGCRVNSAEINQLSQSYVDRGYIPSSSDPDVILVNTCAVTKKGEYESLSKINKLLFDYPHAKIVVTGCANLSKLPLSKNLDIINKNNLPSSYTHQIKDKFSHTDRYLLRIQSGCTQTCSYCIVPQKRPVLWSLPISQAVDIVNQAIIDGYKEIIITGVNIDQYRYGLSDLIESLLINTTIPLISFGSIPINSIDNKLMKLYQKYSTRLSYFLHIPIQSGSDKILKFMNRPYNKAKIINTFKQLTSPLVKGETEGGLKFGTDIIVGFPGETDYDFQQTYDLCQQIGFSKIHVFRFSPRPNTFARELFLNSPKISKDTIHLRSQNIRNLVIK